jgi:hypothetical protein
MKKWLKNSLRREYNTEGARFVVQKLKRGRALAKLVKV